jgi:hypothetical protein
MCFNQTASKYYTMNDGFAARRAIIIYLTHGGALVLTAILTFMHFNATKPSKNKVHKPA